MDTNTKNLPGILDVAVAFLTLQKETTSPNKQGAEQIDHMKMQKLCYFAQAWHLALTGRRLFIGPFIAGQYGAFNLNIHTTFKPFHFRDLGGDHHENKKLYRIINTAKKKAKPVTSEALQTIRDVWLRYGHLDTKVLENLNIQDGGYIEARIGFSEYEAYGNRIDEKTMRRDYTDRLKTDQKNPKGDKDAKQKSTDLRPL